MSEFCHLHCHSEYSLLDGMSRLKDMVQRAKELNQPAIALTDHGVMFGAIEFYREAKKAGVKPIMGVESYLAPRGMKDRDSKLDRKPFHMLLLAQNQDGYQNLLKLSSVAQLEGFYGKPRIDKETLAAHSDGLIATTGCLASEVPRTLMNEGEEAAAKKLEWYLDVFGRERFFLELQGHDIPELRQVNNTLVNWTRKYDIGLIATNDVHYVRKEDAGPHDILLCMQTRDVLSNPKRMKLTPHESYYITSTEEMAHMFSHYPEALSNTVRIAEMCDVDLDPKGYHLPIFPLPKGHTNASYLRFLVEQGLVERYGVEKAKRNPVVRERIERELRIINTMGFDTYFLIVWDLCQFALNADIWWNVRGSGAGSVVAYALQITNIDPLKYDLIFERFLNPARVSMPDFDLDFPDDRRHEMIEYSVRKYGKDKCAAIITFGTLGGRAAVRDVGRTLGIPLDQVNQVSRLVPAAGGKGASLKKLLFDDAAAESWPIETAELRNHYKSNPQFQELLNNAIKLEGQTRHASTHAAGIIISDKPIWEYAPLHRPTKGDATGPIQQVVQFDMNIAESIGLLKVDFLGLATLSIMRRACEFIEQRHGHKLHLSNIPYERAHDEPEVDADIFKAYELIQSGQTVGVFQVEGTGMKRMLQEMQPSEFEHIIAAISLYRPGPMEYIPTYIKRMHGEEEVAYHHEKQEPILNNTYGIIVYQEQIMRTASDLAGYSPGEADLMRRAVSKKKAKEIERHKKIFIDGATNNGVDVASAEKIYSDIEFFARYGFNKSHASDYAVITVQTAYLKAHYPVEYMCALLEVEFDDPNKVPIFITECRQLGIDVLQPDINHSGAKFTIEQNPKNSHLPPDDHRHWAIRVGFGAIKNVGLSAVEQILEEREENGLFKSLDDLCERVNLRSLNRRVIECLAKVGCFDELVRPIAPEHPREIVTHKEVIDRMIGISGQIHKAAEVGQMSMFGMMVAPSSSKMAKNSVLKPLPNIGTVNPRIRLDDEKELLGIYISEHPLQQIATAVGKSITHFCGDVGEDEVGQTVVIAGLLSSLRAIITKKGKPMAFLKLEDLQGSMEVVVFPRVYEKVKEILIEDKILLVRGKVDTGRGDSANVLADKIELYNPKAIDEKGTNGNHQTNGSDPNSSDDDSSLTDAVQYHLTLTVNRTDDDQQDVRGFRKIVHGLQQHKGTDRISLNCFLPDGNRVYLDFPKLTTSWNAVLKDLLQSQKVKVEVKDVTPPPANQKYRQNGRNGKNGIG